MLGFFKKYLNFILTGSFSVVFAACYGAPMNMENPKLIKTSDMDNNAIPGLKVTLYENRKPIDEQFTGNNGNTEFYLTQKEKYHYKVVIEDVDGEENYGKFKSQEIDITKDSFFDLKLENE